MLILNIITLATLILLFCFLYFRKDNSLPNKVLAFTLINPGINFLSNIFVISGIIYVVPYFYFFGQTTCFLLAPLIYSYINLFLGRKIRYLDPLFILTAIFMGMVVYYAIDFSFLSNNQQYAYLNGILNEPYPDNMMFINAIFITMNQVYFTVSGWRIYQYRKLLHQNLSSFKKTRYRYIFHFGVLVWLLNLISLILYAILPTAQVEFAVLPLAITAFYYYIVAYSFNQNAIFNKTDYQNYLNENTVVNLELEKQNSFETTDEASEILQTLNNYLETEKPYTNPELTLETLSQQINIPVDKLSQVINKCLNKNFYDLINELRIEKTKILLKDMLQEHTIEYIAYESGFNSRASFYRAFKKYTGLTPLKYIETSESYSQ